MAKIVDFKLKELISSSNMTQKEIADQLGLTRERVRQIREKSIVKLRESGNVKVLMKYLG